MAIIIIDLTLIANEPKRGLSSTLENKATGQFERERKRD